MTYLPHPARAIFLAATVHSRADQTDAQIEKRLSHSGGGSIKHRAAVTKWIEAAELSALRDWDADLLQHRLGIFEQFADHVLYAEEYSLFDVAHLIPKLPENDISTFNLGNLVLPGDDTIYIHLGRHDALVIDDRTDLYIEGAYVTQTDHEQGDDERSSFRIILVYSDPKFGDEALDRPLGQTLGRNTDFIRFEVGPKATVQQGLATLADNGERGDSKITTAPFKVCRDAFDLVVRSMIYLGLQEKEMEAGFFDGVPGPQAKKALKGIDNAVDYLLAEGFPVVQFVGRNIEPIFRLEEPDWGSQSFGF